MTAATVALQRLLALWASEGLLPRSDRHRATVPPLAVRYDLGPVRVAVPRPSVVWRPCRSYYAATWRAVMLLWRLR